MRNMFGRLILVAVAGFGLAAGARAEDRVVPPSREALHYSFAPIVKTVSPAVVNVYASRTVQQRTSPFMDDPFFRRFFGGGDFGGAPRQRVQQSLGSGVIVDPSGVIVTNYHVIKGADDVKVALSDRRELECDIVLKDERTDLAVLRVRDGGTFPTVPFADSDALEVGDVVLAVGNPFGVGQTVTSGIVSALARTQVGVADYQFFIQTDAAINPGNSGGALVDMEGRLVGINTAIYSRSGGSIGIGFAIPANMVRIVADSARTGSTVKRPWVGATFQAVTADLAEGLGIDRPRGVLITDIVAKGPAEAAGLKVGDLVTAIDDDEVEDPNAVGYRLATKGVGRVVKLHFLRGGKEWTAELALQPAPETVPREEIAIKGNSPFTGATVVNLSPAVAEELGYKGKTATGVIVSAVEPDSLAAGVGLKPGDVIVEVNGQSIGRTSDLQDATAQRSSRWRLAIERGGRLIRTVLG